MYYVGYGVQGGKQYKHELELTAGTPGAGLDGNGAITSYTNSRLRKQFVQVMSRDGVDLTAQESWLDDTKKVVHVDEATGKLTFNDPIEADQLPYKVTLITSAKRI